MKKMAKLFLVFALSLVIFGSAIPAISNPDTYANTLGTTNTVRTIKGEWKNENGKWWYRHADGSYTKNDWEYINNKWYFFNESGWMKTGWIVVNGVDYYLDTNNGDMVTGGTYNLDGKHYFFNTNGSLHKGSSAAYNALKYVGVLDYVYGGTNLTSGADCSGFVQSIYSQLNVNIPRTSGSQGTTGLVVPINEGTKHMIPGDLVFYKNGGTINHVAMYIGNNQVVHSSKPGEKVKVSNWNYRAPAVVRRIVQEN